MTLRSRLTLLFLLAVEVTCNPEHGTTGRRNITGLFQHSEAVDRDWNPGGIWRPVLVYDTGPVKLDRLRVLCRDADDTRAHLRLHARLDSDAARTPSRFCGLKMSAVERPNTVRRSSGVMVAYS